MTLDIYTAAVIGATLVELVRKVPWGAGRESLSAKADILNEQAQKLSNEVHDLVVTQPLGGKYGDVMHEADEKRELSHQKSWQAQLYALAAEVRFPRDGDTVVQDFVFKTIKNPKISARGYSEHTTAARDVSEAVRRALEKEGIELNKLSLPPTIYELVEKGAERPYYVKPELWEQVVERIDLLMMIDNTPHEFLDGAEHDSDHYYDWSDDHEACEVKMKRCPS